MHATPDPAALLKPLADFYVGRALPDARLVEAADIPQPYRRLLDHSNDMTSTLQRFHGEVLRVKLLDRRLHNGWYEREVLLVTQDTHRAVEFGAIKISLQQFRDDAQHEILRAEMPLGAILQLFSIDFQSKPRGFFEIQSDDVMNAALTLAETNILYGRCNEITGAQGEILAEIVEILPPVTDFEQDV